MRVREGFCVRQDGDTWFCLHLGDGVVDGDAHTLVEELEAEDLGCAHGAVLICAGERDVEGQHLVGVPG